MKIASRHGRDLMVGEGATRIMGVLNVTPDSFSDGGTFLAPEKAIQRGLSLVAQGADVLDIGGESTRPGHLPVPEGEQIQRLLPVLEGLRPKIQAPISVDTSSAEVAATALCAGADWINDVSALSGDPEMAAVLAAQRCPVVLMHRFVPPREPDEANQDPRGAALVATMVDRLAQSLKQALAAGVAADAILLDPGLGFGTLFEDNIAIYNHIDLFRRLQCPLLAGPSRKSFLGQITGKPATERVHATAAAVAALAFSGVEVIRVHDVAAMVDVVRVADTLRQSEVTGNGMERR